jgi:3-dehydroquinate synthase
MALGAEAAVMPEAGTQEVVVDLGRRSYTIAVGAGVLGELGPRMGALGLGGRCGLVTSERVGALYLRPVVSSLRLAGFEPVTVEIADGEEQKNLGTLGRIYDRLLAAGIERTTPLVALGGGVIGDLTGFAAATLLRGVPLVQVPTTLLAQVDAAIGGKTAVDHGAGKNLIGAFHQPRLVLADVTTLATLPRRELLAGLAEVVKYGIIGDARLFARLEAEPDAVLGLDPETLVPMVAACARQKAAFVVADEHETTGERSKLNFGHTVGHAVETATGYGRVLHGEAVAIGMVAAARASRARGLCDAATVGRIRALLERLGLPVEVPADVAAGALADAMRRDKKSAGGRIRFVAVEDIGRVRLVELTVEEIVSQL